MEFLGTVREIWRYPVSSLGGEQLNAVEIGPQGVAGDRIWCLVDAQTGQPAAPEKEQRWRPALFLKSRLRLGLCDIGFPDGVWLSTEDTDLDQRLRDHFGFEVSARPYAKPTGDPDAGFVVTNRYEPSPLHLVTTSSLDLLATLVDERSIDSRRFRPTVLIQTSNDQAFLETSWVGHRLKMGQALVQAVEETKRCGMTLIAQPDLRENPDILRSILRHNRRNLGIYCSIDEPGTLSLGEPVHRLLAGSGG